MRIRTIKPAFWSNEKMACLPVFTRLLAIGLLNYSDDYGYFWANPLMIRGALFPFEEDSSMILRGLAELESEGYILLGKTIDGRSAGKVKNFSTHQKVDKPYKSEIQPIIEFDDQSSNDSRMIDDRSALYRIGKEGNGKDNTCDLGGSQNGNLKGAAPEVPYAQIVGSYHDLCPSLPRVTKLSEPRKKAIRSRFVENQENATDWFADLFRKAHASDFISGRDGKWSGAGFDWLLNPANALKVIEGNYANKTALVPTRVNY